jgi:phospholipid/cholesterol/gamma-HCH transport system permease protein
MQFIVELGRYIKLLGAVFSKPEQWKTFRNQVFKEMNTLGIDSLPIISIISVFMGAVITIQTASNLDGGFIPLYSVGYAARQSMILEFSPTIIALILIGKVGSSISSELGTMRVSEQIDALEIMGINSANYLILPKVIACVLFNPFLITLSMVIGIGGGYLATVFTGIMAGSDYEFGVRYDFNSFDYTYAMIKTILFAFVIVTVPAFYGYYVKGGSVEVGRASTKAVVSSSIVILILNYVVTQLLLI